MATEMTNIDIKDFASVSGLKDTDNVLLALATGTHGKITVSLFRNIVKDGITPSIKDGKWWIGTVNTSVDAIGKTPQFRKGTLGVEYKYTTEADSVWKLLVNYDDIKWQFSDLTPEQRKTLIPKLSDMTKDEIAILQQPANDMIAQLKKTDDTVKSNEQTRQSQETTRQTQEAKRQQDTSTAINNANAATADAQDTADHPTYIGTDNYVYEWDKAAKTYNKTDKLVKSPAFSIDVQYTSVAELEADRKAYNDGLFAMVNTNDVENPDNARLYIRKNGAWNFVVDMSGAIGFTGKTPQISIGTVSLGENITNGTVTLTADGTDSNGNPRYKLNYVIPRLVYDDLTPAQIAELQRPASDMIAQLTSTDNAVKQAESARVTAENTRVSNENTRESNETTRQTQETKRQTDTSTAISDAQNATQNAQTAADRSKGYADHPIKIGDNGNWWAWDETTQAYKDTGHSAQGGMIYPTLEIKDSDMCLYVRGGAGGDNFSLGTDGILNYNTVNQ